MSRTMSVDLAVLGAFALATPIWAVAAGLAPQDQRAPVAVIFAPWTESSEAIAKATDAGARLLAPAGVAFAVMVAPDHEAYFEDVRAAGALLLIDLRKVPFCGSARAPDGA